MEPFRKESEKSGYFIPCRLNGVVKQKNIFMTNQKFDGFLDLSYQEKLEITGGDTGYYGNGPKLSNLRANAKAVADAALAVAHEVGDLFRGIFIGHK
jgi:hypothetical protein